MKIGYFLSSEEFNPRELIRHPAVIAQAAATCAVLLEGRFALGLGSGEALNEHILGDHWPQADERLEMLEEAVQVIRRYRDAGFDELYIQQIGPDQERFFQTYANEILPHFNSDASTLISTTA
jgi:alkanesulfonate monooxygenase SsuD/methylene tetrahydromethanopterin reductase-like flavin-dependent oxidoreductase (luciferase family)